jgi:hypothetical protein
MLLRTSNLRPTCASGEYPSRQRVAAEAPSGPILNLPSTIVVILLLDQVCVAHILIRAAQGAHDASPRSDCKDRLLFSSMVASEFSWRKSAYTLKVVTYFGGTFEERDEFDL